MMIEEEEVEKLEDGSDHRRKRESVLGKERNPVDDTVADFEICSQSFTIFRNDRVLDDKISGGGALVAVPNSYITHHLLVYLFALKVSRN